MGILDQLKLTDSGLRGRVQQLLDAPAELLLPERLLMYSLVRGLRPERCLEIGTHFGGSTTITCAALDDVGSGRMVCVDPNPLVPADLWATLAHRATMIRGTSPSALPEVVAVAGGLFDFVFIDGDHTQGGVVRDVEGVLTVAAPGAHLLFHDSHYWEVRDAPTCMSSRYSTRMGRPSRSSSATFMPAPPSKAGPGPMPTCPSPA